MLKNCINIVNGLIDRKKNSGNSFGILTFRSLKIEGFNMKVDIMIFLSEYIIDLCHIFKMSSPKRHRPGLQELLMFNAVDCIPS